MFDPLRAGELHLRNRIVMAPMTRIRAGTTHIPNALMQTYYAQRASAGLVLTEATMIAADACAFTGEGGIFDHACIAGWTEVTSAVHAAGGLIMVQLWHPGRAAHSLLNGAQPISSTDRAIRDATIHTPRGAQPCEMPRRLRLEELPGIVDIFRDASQSALAAGFDGVQIHGAHGYLLDQFLRDGVNDRTDEYGGSLANRAKLLLEVTDAAIGVLGAGRVSVRISPLVGFNDITDSNPPALVEYVARALSERNIAFFELRHADFRAPDEQQLAAIARRHFRGPLFVNGGYDYTGATGALERGDADAIVFGGAFIANPDLVERFRRKQALNATEPTTVYVPGAEGYTDYPSLTGPPVRFV
jgi:N-ethylmaleimide reductase